MQVPEETLDKLAAAQRELSDLQRELRLQTYGHGGLARKIKLVQQRIRVLKWRLDMAVQS